MAKVLSLMATYSGDGSLYNRTVAELVYNRTVAEIDDQLSNIGENKRYAGTPYIKCVHAGQCYIKCVHTRSYPVHGVRTPSAHIPRQLSAHPWGFSVVFSQQYWVIMVLVRGIDYFIIIIEPHDP